MAPPAPQPAAARSAESAPAASTRPGLLIEEKLGAALLAVMVALMFAQAATRNCGALAGTAFGNWLAHATEVLPSGLTWLTFLACGAVTRRNDLLRVELLRAWLAPAWQRRMGLVLWWAWLLFFAVLGGTGLWAAGAQRHQTTKLAWLPAWAVALSVPAGSALVIWRTLQVLRESRRLAAGTR